MTHDEAWRLLPDLVTTPDHMPEGVRAHVASCHICQRQLFRLQRVDRLLRIDGRDHAPVRASGRRAGRWLAAAAPLLVAAAVAVHLVLAPSGASTMTLRLPGGVAVANAQVHHVGTRQVVELTPGNAGLSGTTSYVLWGQAGGDPPVRVGMFMSSRSGTCRARFVMPGHLDWQRLWITPAADSTAVVAQTTSG